MRLKSLVIAVAVLAALSGVVWFLNRPTPPPSADARVGQPLVDAATIEKAARVKLADAGKTVELAKQADGTWTVASYHGLPADFSKLARFIDDLRSATIEQFVTGQPERLSRLEFKDTRLVLLDADGKDLWSATLGKTAEAGGRFVRFGDEPKGYRAKFNAWLDAESKNWADSTLVNLPADDIAKVELSFPEGDGAPVVASRAKKEDAFTTENTPDGQQLKTATITSLLNSVANLRFSETTAPDDANATAAKQHARTLKLTTFDGKTWTLALGRKPEQKIVKAPEAKPEALLGSATGEHKPEDGGPAKVLEPVTETIPAGPVFAFVTAPDEKAPINALMQKRAFQIYDYTFTSLPQKRDDLFEPKPAAAPAPATPDAPAPAEPAPANPPPGTAP
ncbi:MAG TPA: DUF4340 domain-containing protein [Opitutaceae bacterium]